MVVMLNFKKMAKEISKVVKLQVREVLQPSPPVGPALELLVISWSSVSNSMNSR
jgi:ribosomal protein L11